MVHEICGKNASRTIFIQFFDKVLRSFWHIFLILDNFNNTGNLINYKSMLICHNYCWQFFLTIKFELFDENSMKI